MEYVSSISTFASANSVRHAMPCPLLAVLSPFFVSHNLAAASDVDEFDLDQLEPFVAGYTGKLVLKQYVSDLPACSFENTINGYSADQNP